MLNNTLLEFIKKEAACLTGADRAKAIKVSAMARRAWKETDDNTLKEALLTYANANKKEYVNGRYGRSQSNVRRFACQRQ